MTELPNVPPIRRRGASAPLCGSALLGAAALLAGACAGGGAPDGPPASPEPSEASSGNAAPVVRPALPVVDEHRVELADGTEVRFEDVPAEGADFVDYTVHGYEPALRAYVVRVRLYEGGGYILLHRVTGDTLWVDALPVVSPDARRFAVASSDLVAGYAPNLLQVYRIEEDGFAEELHLDLDAGPADWAPKDPVWRDDETFRVTVERIGPDGLPAPDGHAVVRRSGGAWTVDLPGPGPGPGPAG